MSLAFGSRPSWNITNLHGFTVTVGLRNGSAPCGACNRADQSLWQYIGKPIPEIGYHERLCLDCWKSRIAELRPDPDHSPTYTLNQVKTWVALHARSASLREIFGALAHEFALQTVLSVDDLDCARELHEIINTYFHEATHAYSLQPPPELPPHEARERYVAIAKAGVDEEDQQEVKQEDART